jgi:hypothetical protein
VVITNTSTTDTVTIDTLDDVIDEGAAIDVTANATLVCTDEADVTVPFPLEIAPGGVVTCTYDQAVAGNFGDDPVDNTITASGTDDDTPAGPVTASDDAHVTFANDAAAITVVKTVDADGDDVFADTEAINEPGGTATYQVVITNTSTTDTVTIDTLDDVIDGGAPIDVTANATLACTDEADVTVTFPLTIAPGGVVTCTYDQAVAGNFGDPAVDNTITASGTDDDTPAGTVSDDDDAHVTFARASGQIAPTATSCQDFVNGRAGDLTEILYGTKSGKVNNVAPGVLFYYSFVVAPSSSFTVTVNQVDMPNAPFPAFGVQQQQAFFYNPNCTKRSSTVMTISGGGALVTFNVTGATAGTTYIVGIKYNPGSVVGTPVSAPFPSSTYTFSTSVNGTLVASSPDSLVLRRK